jgi:hypothetical protein
MESIESHLLTVDLSAGEGEKQLARHIVYEHEDLDKVLEEIMDRCAVTLQDINIEKL